MGKVYGNRWESVTYLGETGQAYIHQVKDREEREEQGEFRYFLKRLKNLKRIRRFKREIEAVRELSHPNIVRLIDFDLEGKEPYLVTEYCSGGSLATAEPFWQGSPLKALEIFQQICEGVAYAHSRGVVHRDLKPDNIFLRSKDGPAVVGDFGLCYDVEEDDTRVTPTGEAIGSRFYMAPELEHGREAEISPESDTYSLGKLLYWLLSGRVFNREKHRDRDWDLMGWDSERRQCKNVYMEHVNRLLDKMIVDKPEGRWSVEEVLSRIEDVTRLVQNKFTPVADDIPQPCLYCGQGQYRPVAIRNNEVRNYGGLTKAAAVTSLWRDMVCDTCGHVQTFRLDMAPKKGQEWWR
jgi:serine/threonine protein kinase